MRGNAVRIPKGNREMACFVTYWAWMGVLCITGALGHYLLIWCYEVAEASAVQPFAYFQLVFGATIGVLVFSEVIRWNVALGAAIVVAAGLFTLWREQKKAQEARRQAAAPGAG